VKTSCRDLIENLSAVKKNNGGSLLLLRLVDEIAQHESHARKFYKFK